MEKWFSRSRKYDLGFSSRFRIPDPDFFTHPGSMGQKGIGSRIRNIGFVELDLVGSASFCRIRIQIDI
jgi:hypothetical protein